MNILIMQPIRNACSFCDSPIPLGQSVCKGCINFHDIKTCKQEDDGCGCDA